MSFTEAEDRACRHLIDLSLEEDLGTVGDLTSQAIIPESMEGRAAFVARVPGVLAGLPILEIVATKFDARLRVEPLKNDGGTLVKGDRIAEIRGPMRGILAAERTALNFLQHLSGIATLTRHYVDAVAGLRCKILDTRKTTPGWRQLEKYAVRQGGGHNHRIGLYDGILIKDNHLAALRIGSSPMTDAVMTLAVLTHLGPRVLSVPVEIEVDSLEQFDPVLSLTPDMILLDNMTLDQMREAVKRRNAVSPGVLLEASGGIMLANVRTVAETGVDRISIGALTHSAPALDIALDYVF